MPIPSDLPQEYPNESCLCSTCHLSSELFPRRQDGRIILPGLPASRDPTPLLAETWAATVQSDSEESVQEEFFLSPLAGPNELPPVSSLPEATSHITGEHGSRPYVRSNTRTAVSGTSFGQSPNVAAGTDGPSGIPEHPMGSPTSSNRVRPRPRSLSHSYHTTTTTVSNPYPMPVAGSYPRLSGESSLDNGTKISAPEQTMSSSFPPPSTSNNNSVTPTLKFCPPFVSSDRIALPASNDNSKEGVTMIPWSARRRKQKYRSGFDSGTGQGKSKTMFRYYGPDSGPD